MKIQANGIAIEVDDRGPVDGEPLLLIMGLGMQLIAWPEQLVQALIARSFRVMRFDNRDAGLSEGFDALGVPHLAWGALRHALHLPVRAPYSLDDMAGDAVGVLDALGITRAHVCGASMGGMVAQVLAARHPQRVKSLTLMMTSSGARSLPQAQRDVQRALLSRSPPGAAPEELAAHMQAFLTLIGSPAYRPDPGALRRRVEASLRRAYRPGGVLRQLMAVAAHGDRSALLRNITAPTRVVHGLADPLIPVAAAHDLLAKIAGATGDLIDGMGHDLPEQLLPRFAANIAHAAERSVRVP